MICVNGDGEQVEAAVSITEEKERKGESGSIHLGIYDMGMKGKENASVKKPAFIQTGAAKYPTTLGLTRRQVGQSYILWDRMRFWPAA